MIRLLLRAALVSLLTAFILTQVGLDQQLVVWEIALLAVLVWQLTELPRDAAGPDRPLFEWARREPSRLPRVVTGHELAVVDAVNGYLAPERRLQPLLRQIASHRLAQIGVSLESSGARDRLGPETWDWLIARAPHVPESRELDAMISRIEEL